MRSVTCFVALAAGALILSDAPAAAAGDPAAVPPPAKTAPAAAATQSASSIPPPVPIAERSAPSLVSTVSDATEAGVGALQRVAGATPTELMTRRTEQYFTYKGYGLTALDAGINLYDGKPGEAIDTIGGAALDVCIDRAIDSACVYATTATGLPGAVGCGIVKFARFCHETWTDESWGEKAFKATGASGFIVGFLGEKTREMEQSRAAQQSSFQATSSSNEDHAAAVAAMQAAPYSPSPASYDDGSGAFFGALMTGLFDASAAMSTPIVPPMAAPAAAPSGACHPGHDEAAHPGGCHGTPIGQN